MDGEGPQRRRGPEEEAQAEGSVEEAVAALEGQERRGPVGVVIPRLRAPLHSPWGGTVGRLERTRDVL